MPSWRSYQQWREATWRQRVVLLVGGVLCATLLYVGSLPLMVYYCYRGTSTHPRVMANIRHMRWIDRNLVPDSWSPEYRKTVETWVGVDMIALGIGGIVLMRMLVRPRRADDWTHDWD